MRLTTLHLRLPWFFLLSFAIHAGLLWQFRSLLRDELKPFALTPIAVVPYSEPLSPSSTARTQAASRARAENSPPGRRAAPADSATPNDAPNPGNMPGSGEASASTGNFATDDRGVGFAGPDSSTGAVGTKDGRPGSGTGTGTAKAPPQPFPGKGIPSAAERSVIVIPPALQRTTSPYEGEVYAEADFYALFTPDLRTTINVPANEVCLDGDTLRTHERKILTRRVTDISKCRYESYGDEQERMRCPPEAHTVLITHASYLSSPVRYGVNMCMAYDQSSCYINPRDDGPDQEICRVRGQYDGIWAAGTLFHYPCAKSSSQLFVHSLQYEVRFLQNVEFPDERMRRRLVHREKRSVAPCQ